MGKRRHRAKAKPKPKTSLLRKFIHWFLELLKWFLSFLAGGVITAFCPGIFEACKVTIENTSSTFRQKIVDFRYVSAAQCDLHDLSALAFVLVVIIFLALLWMLLVQTHLRLRDMTRDFENRKEKERLLGKIKSGKEPLPPPNNLDAIRADNSKRIAYLSRKLPLCRWVSKCQLYAIIVGTFYFVPSMLLMLDSHFLVRSFQRNCTVIRPYVSETEMDVLKLKWIIMQSKADYLAIKDELATYRERIQMYSAVAPEEEIVGGDSGIDGEK
ncbi:MAG: hypothetical protein IKP58_07755 [Victivallales bacterium]|nr:hypothetical protein [Victivallales bacterium]